MSQQASLASFFKKKPATAKAATSGGSSAGLPADDSPSSTPPLPKDAAAGKRPLTGGGDDAPATKRPSTHPSTKAPAKQTAAVMDEMMEVDGTDELPLSAIGRKAASSIMDAEPSSSCEADPVDAPPERTPSAAAGRRMTPAEAKDVYAQAAALPSVPSPPPDANAKTVSFEFLRDRRDLSGKRPGEPGFDKTTIRVKLTGNERLTPGQEQYWEIKKHHADCIIAFKMGKFYELFEEDALLAHRVLDLAFMGKGAPHAGFPEAALCACPRPLVLTPWTLPPPADRAPGALSAKYAQKLVELGYKVGVVEQMETPEQLAERNRKMPKGAKKDKAVRRELCSVITKGTAFHRADQATYLLSVSEDIPTGTLGVTFVDAATGHFHVGQCVDDAQHNCLRTLLAQLRPDEIIVNEALVSADVLSLLRRAVPDGLFNPLSGKTFWACRDAAASALAPYFEGQAEEAWPEALAEVAEASPPVGLAAFGGCAGYLKRLLLDAQLLSMGHVSVWNPTDGERSGGGGAALVLDSKALENLEVFENSSDRSSNGTLFSILNKCVSAFGKRRLRSWLCAPPRDLEAIGERQEAIGALMANAELRTLLATALRKLPDLERLVARVHAFSVAQSANNATHYADVGRLRLAELIKTLEGFEALHKAMHGAADHLSELKEAAPHLAEAMTIGGGFPDLHELLASFRAAFDWTQAKAEGRVMPSKGVDATYDVAKAAVDDAVAVIEGIRDEWRASLSDRKIDLWSPAASPTEPYQLAVPVETLNRRGTPREFIQMSAKKDTKRFYTPPLKAAVADYLSGKEQLDAALSSSARRLYGRFSRHFGMWHRAVSAAAELDCLLSLATVSTSPGFCRPRFFSPEENTPFLEVEGGVNICVQAVRGGADCIPNDILVGTSPAAASSKEGADAGDDGEVSPLMLLVTGPNMGGKSTLLRQACLTALMAHLGCYVPATSCALTPVDRIFTRVGANDAIMAGLSTFRVELEETSTILKHATKHSIVILDELGRGTATFDGMAIAHAVLTHLIEHTRCRSLFATHYHALTRQFEATNDQVALHHMACAVDKASKQVTFLYKFARGACHRSHGVNVARLAGLPAAVLDLAAAKSAELEAVLDEKYAVHLARRVMLAGRGAEQGARQGEAAEVAEAEAEEPDAEEQRGEALVDLWREVSAGCHD